MNRFKGLDLVNKVPEELWTEVRNIVQEAVSKTIPKKKRNVRRQSVWASFTKWLSEERRDLKSKVERERYTQLNAEFVRNARLEEKAFSMKVQRNRGKQQNGKTRDLT